MLCAQQVRKELQEAKACAAAGASAAAAAAKAAAAASAPAPRKEPVQDGDAEQPEDAEAAADDPESESQVCNYIHMDVRLEQVKHTCPSHSDAIYVGLQHGCLFPLVWSCVFAY